MGKRAWRRRKKRGRSRKKKTNETSFLKKFKENKTLSNMFVQDCFTDTVLIGREENVEG